MPIVRMHPNRKTPQWTGIPALAAILFTVLFVVPFVAGCGIESYPYLFPAESIAGDAVDFRHDSRNDPNVFQGYEIYYRIYDDSIIASGNIDTAQIKADMDSYFNGSSDFFGVSFDDLGETSISSSKDRGYRRTYVEGRGDSIPLIPVASGDVDTSFTAEIINPENDYLNLEIFNKTYRLRRNTTKEIASNFPDFTNNGDDYLLSDNDIIESQIGDIPPEGGERLIIAFFAVPYGFDSTNFTGIFANGISEDMTFIGTITYNLI